MRPIILSHNVKTHIRNTKCVRSQYAGKEHFTNPYLSLRSYWQLKVSKEWRICFIWPLVAYMIQWVILPSLIYRQQNLESVYCEKRRNGFGEDRGLCEKLGNAVRGTSDQSAQYKCMKVSKLTIIINFTNKERSHEMWGEVLQSNMKIKGEEYLRKVEKTKWLLR